MTITAAEPDRNSLTVDISLALDTAAASIIAAIPEQHAIVAWANSAYRGTGSAEVAIRIVDDNESQTLNLQYRQQDKPTNVLSFPLDMQPLDGFHHLGDIVICASVVEREAREQNKLPGDHWAHMTIHGMLHLQGYDHATTTDAESMEALEAEILASFNIPNPYQACC